MINSTFDTQFEIPDKIVFIWIFNVFLQFKGNRSIFNPNGLGTIIFYHSKSLKTMCKLL